MIIFSQGEYRLCQYQYEKLLHTQNLLQLFLGVLLKPAGAQGSHGKQGAQGPLVAQLSYH